MEWRVPLADIDFSADESAAVLEVLESRWLTMGAVTQAFEEKFAAFVGSRHAIAVTNGTAALHLACLVSGLGPGDEVIVPSLTFVATANAVRYVGATPVFADIESLQNLCISPAAIAPLITKRTRAILVMHYGGYACDMPAILALAEERGLVVLEDAAHAVGSTLEGRALGTWGRVGCYSFFSNKNLSTGEGGMLVTDDDALAARLRLLRSHGMTSPTWDRHQGHAFSYEVTALGFNYRMDEIRAAIGRVQLGKLERNNSRRRELTLLYRKRLKETAPDLELPFLNHPGISAAHLFPVLLPAGQNRLAFMEQLRKRGVQTSIHYPPIHRFQIYRQADKASLSLPVTEEVAKREVTLPLYPTMTEEQVEIVVNAVKEAL